MTTRRDSLATGLAISGEIIGMLMQLTLVWLAWRLLWENDEIVNMLELLTWCILATAYLGSTALALNVSARRRAPETAATRILIGHPLARLLSTLTTFGSSLMGLSVALDLITSLGAAQPNPVAEFAAVWAMLLSWVMFNWGYARIYFSHYHRATEPPLEFPGTASPRISDFAYLAFTNATTFAVSDVKVRTTRMRWTVVWHTTLAFFFNALIIGLTMKVISDGRLFAELFS